MVATASTMLAVVQGEEATPAVGDEEATLLFIHRHRNSPYH